MTSSDICFPQELDYSTSCVHTGGLCRANLYTGRNRWEGVGMDAARRAANAVLCQRYAVEAVERKKIEKICSLRCFIQV